jgi:hypothetical protein
MVPFLNRVALFLHHLRQHTFLDDLDIAFVPQEDALNSNDDTRLTTLDPLPSLVCAVSSSSLQILPFRKLYSMLKVYYFK